MVIDYMEKFINPKTKLKRLPLTEQVYQVIKDGIVSGKWQIGDKLPSENELAEAFGVNRLTVRGALQKLNILGIVETRVGEGTFVLSFNFRKYIQEVAEFTMQPEHESEIRDFRKLVEVECARLAIATGTDKELAVLKKLSDECSEIGKRLIESYTDKSFEKEYFIDFANADLNFHYQIFKMSHNSLYINSFHLVREAIYHYILMTFEKVYNQFIVSGGEALNYDNINMHDKIYKYIKEKDFVNCKKVYLNMIDASEPL